MYPLDSSPDSDSIRFWFRLGLSVRYLLAASKDRKFKLAKSFTEIVDLTKCEH